MKKKRTEMLGIAVLLLLAGCKTNPTVYMLPVRTAPADSVGGYKKSSADRPYYDKTGTVASVRSGEVVKAYGVNRYVDPADPRVMHERHAVYRLEAGPGWVTQIPQGRQGILLGPVVGLKKVEDAPAPRTSEVNRELLTARQALDKNNDQLTEIKQNQVGIAEFLKNSAEVEAKLAAIAEGLNQRLRTVESKLGQDSSAPEAEDSQGRDGRTVAKKSSGANQETGGQP